MVLGGIILLLAVYLGLSDNPPGASDIPLIRANENQCSFVWMSVCMCEIATKRLD